MTPDIFAHNANAWMASLSSLAAPLIGLVGSVLGILAYIKSKTNELRLNGHSNELTTLMLNSPPASEVVAITTDTPLPPAYSSPAPPHASILPVLAQALTPSRQLAVSAFAATQLAEQHGIEATQQIDQFALLADHAKIDAAKIDAVKADALTAPVVADAQSPPVQAETPTAPLLAPYTGTSGPGVLISADTAGQVYTTRL